MKQSLVFILLIAACSASAQDIRTDYRNTKITVGKQKVWYRSLTDQEPIIVFNNSSYYIDCDGIDRKLKNVRPDMNLRPYTGCGPIPRLQVSGISSAEFYTAILGMKWTSCSIDHFDTASFQVFCEPASDKARKIVTDICHYQSLQPNFNIGAAPVNKASAIFDSNKRYILYDPVYLASLGKNGKSKWKAYFVFAHEIAHHLNGNMFDSPNLPDRQTNELAADQWAGMALGRMGASRGQALAWVNTYKPTDDNYPSKGKRKNAVLVGWKSADPQDNVYSLSIGASMAFSGMFNEGGSFKTDQTKYYSLDVLFHPQIPGSLILNKALAHFAVGINYLPAYNIQYRTFDTYSNFPSWDQVTTETSYSSSGYSAFSDHRFLFSARYYSGNYFKSSSNISVGYSAGPEIHQVKLAISHAMLKKKAGVEFYIAPTSFNLDHHGFHTWKMMFGLSATGSFIKYAAKK